MTVYHAVFRLPNGALVTDSAPHASMTRATLYAMALEQAHGVTFVNVVAKQI